MLVYLIQNLTNGKCYVGQHSGDDIDWYFQENIKSALRGSTGKRLLYRAIRKYGASSFSVSCIYTPADKEEMDRAEIAFIKLFGTKNPGLGYNLTDGGDGALGLVATEETRKKLRAAGLARGIHENCRSAQKEYLKTRVFTDEHRQKLSAVRKGVKFSEETLKKMSDAKKGIAPSPETIAKIVAKTTGKKRAPRSDEWKKKIGEGNRGKVMSPEARQKISAGIKAHWEEKRQLEVSYVSS